jgi:hypothetical protein
MHHHSDSLLLADELFSLLENDRTHIHFGEPLTREMPARASLSDEEKEHMFYARDELRAMRDEASTLAKQVIRKQDLAKELSYAAVVKRTYDACCQGSSVVPKSEDIRLLVRWGKLRPARRGLEKVCVPDVCQRSRDRRLNAIQTVLEIQKRSKHLKRGEREQLLRKASVTVGQVTKVHARVLGIVDAAAVKDMLETETTVLEKRALDAAFGKKLDTSAGEPPLKKIRTSQPVSVGVATA